MIYRLLTSAGRSFQKSTELIRANESKLLVVLFLLAFCLYLPGVWWGLPHATAPDRRFGWAPDELAPLGPVAELYSVFLSPHPTYNPQYPLFHYFVQAAFVAPYLGLLWATGGFSQPSVEYPFGLSNPLQSLALMTLLARLASLLMAAGVIVIGYKTGKTLWGRREGILTAFLVLLLFPMFYYARTSNVDMAALFWVALGLLIYAEILVDKLTARQAVLLGLFAALAAATKDASYAAFAAIALIFLFMAARKINATAGERRAFFKHILLGLTICMVVYIFSSGLIFSPDRFIQHLRFITQGSQAGRESVFYYSHPASLGGYLSLLWSTTAHLAGAMGIPMLLSTALGITLCLIKDPRKLLFLLPGLAMILGIILPVRFVQFRFVFITAYVLAIFAAYGISTILRNKDRVISGLAWVGLFIVVTFALARGLDLTYQMVFDSRYFMAEWFQEQAKPGDRVGYYGSPLKLPALDKDIETIPMPGQSYLNTNPEIMNDPPEFVVIIPQQDFEPVHEWTLSAEDYQSLVDGTMGYERVVHYKTRSLFPDQPVTFVNPNLQIFVKNDHIESPGENP